MYICARAVLESTRMKLLTSFMVSEELRGGL
jgi:hypothetical protein